MFGFFKPNRVKNQNSEPLIHLQHVMKNYEGLAGDVVALKGIDLQVNQGSLWSSPASRALARPRSST